MMRSSKMWLIVGPVIAVVVLVMGWVLLVSPKMAEASTLADETASAQATNVQAQAKLTVLQQQSKTLPAQKAQLAAMEKQIPEDPAVADLIRALNAAATATGVHLDQVTPGTLTGLNAATTATTTTTTGGLQQMQVQIATTGPYANQIRFIAAVEHLERAMLVTSVSLSGDPTTAAAAGTVAGLKLALSATAFVSTPVVAAAPPAADPSAPPAAPAN